MKATKFIAVLLLCCLPFLTMQGGGLGPVPYSVDGRDIAPNSVTTDFVAKSGPALSGKLNFQDSAGNIRGTLDMVSGMYIANGFQPQGTSMVLAGSGLGLDAQPVIWRSAGAYGTVDGRLAQTGPGAFSLINPATGAGAALTLGTVMGGQATMTANATGTLGFNGAGYSETIYNATATATIASATITLPGATTSYPGETVSYIGKANITTVTLAGTVDIGTAPTSYTAGNFLSWQCTTPGHWIRKQ